MLFRSRNRADAEAAPWVRGRRILVPPANRETVEIFLAMGTQWDLAGQSGMPTGLDYARVEAVMNMMRVPARRRPDVFTGLRLMEYAALPIRQRRAREAQERAQRGPNWKWRR